MSDHNHAERHVALFTALTNTGMTPGQAKRVIEALGHYVNAGFHDPKGFHAHVAPKPQSHGEAEGEAEGEKEERTADHKAAKERK